jgi:hypothetical protein
MVEKGGKSRELVGELSGFDLVFEYHSSCRPTFQCLISNMLRRCIVFLEGYSCIPEYGFIKKDLSFEQGFAVIFALRARNEMKHHFLDSSANSSFWGSLYQSGDEA